MKKFRALLLAATASFLFIACASAPTIAEMEMDIADFQLPALPAPGNSIVYIIRPSMLGFAINFEVFIDEKSTEYFLGSTKGGEYIYFEMAPGTRKILSQAENLAEYVLTAEKGSVYFLQQSPRMGVLFARNDLMLSVDTEGKYWVKRLKPGKMGR